MQKIVVSSLVAVLLVPGTCAFAQFKDSAKAAKNLANLDRVVARATKGVVIGRPVVTDLPPGLVRGNAIGLLRVKMPKAITPVNKSYVTFLNNKFQELSTFPTPESLAGITANEWANNPKRVFYQDQSELARDLDKFYQGKADIFIGPDGREVKFYALPVDGILYKPVGYTDAVVLNSSEYFVIYDVAAKTGKIAENTPEVYNLFKPRLEDEIWSAMGASKEFDDLNNLCDAILLAHLHKVRVERLRVSSDVETLVKAGKQTVWKQLNSSMELLNYLQKLPTVRETTKGFKAYVLELPVEGLSWTDRRDGTKHNYTRHDNVMLFFEMGAVGIYPRADLENPQLFKPAAKVEAAQHPQNAFWKLYESEKKAWQADRQNKIFENMWNYLYPYHFNSEAEFGKALHAFHGKAVNKVRSKMGDVLSEVYEIPLPNLTCNVNGQEIVADPDEYVFLYNEQTGGNLVKRTDLENANLYQFVAQ